MSEQKTVYEVVEPWAKTGVVLVRRDANIRSMTVKFVGVCEPNETGQGSTAGGFNSTARIDDCDFTPADAWARFMSRMRIEIAGLEGRLEARRSVLADAVEKAGNEPAP